MVGKQIEGWGRKAKRKKDHIILEKARAFVSSMCNERERNDVMKQKDLEDEPVFIGEMTSEVLCGAPKEGYEGPDCKGRGKKYKAHRHGFNFKISEDGGKFAHTYNAYLKISPAPKGYKMTSYKQMKYKKV